MIRSVSRLSGAAGMVLGLAATAVAMPPAFDMAPDDAMLVVGVENLSGFQESVNALATAIESPVPLPSLDSMLMSTGLSDGVKADGSAAIFVFPVEADDDEDDMDDDDDDDDMDDEWDDDAEERVIIVLPTDNYDELKAAFQAEAQDGIDVGEKDGDEVFMKNLGNGYAALSPERELLEGFSGQGGKLGTLRNKVGPLGARLADNSGLVTIINVAVAGPMAREAFGNMGGMMGAGMPMGEGAEGMMDMGDWLTEVVTRDAEYIVGGMSAGAMGLSLDMAANFKEGSYLSQAFTADGNAGALLDKLPNQPFFMAGAIDTSSSGVKQLIKDWNQRAEEAMGDRPPTDFSEGIEMIDGKAIGIGASPAALFGGGLLVNTTAYVKTNNPQGYMSGMKDSFGEMDGATYGASEFATTYENNATTIGGKDVDAWSMKITPSDPQAGMAMQMVYGPTGGPNGYIAAVDGGVVQTMSKNSSLMQQAMDSATGDAGLAKDRTLQQVAGRLPENRLAVGYIGVKPIMDAVVPMLGMMGAPADIEIPDVLPPIGAAISAADGDGHFAVFVPAPALKVFAKLGMSMGGGMGGPGGFAPAGEPEEPAGQPRF